jgi:uncharacterized membrane protein YfcA
MTDRLMAFFTFAVLASFLGILFYRVPRLDIAVIVGLTLALVFYDFFLSPTRAGRRRG